MHDEMTFLIAKGAAERSARTRAYGLPFPLVSDTIFFLAR